MFQSFDSNGDGVISMQELEQALTEAKKVRASRGRHRFFVALRPQQEMHVCITQGDGDDENTKRLGELKELMADIDQDGSGGIDYNEFLCSTMNQTWLERMDVLRKTFEDLDADKNGRLCKEEIAQVLDITTAEVWVAPKDHQASHVPNVMHLGTPDLPHMARRHDRRRK
eukprot:scaffold196_cov371-Prasinococcus_capsulatus_cf.AAC.28